MTTSMIHSSDYKPSLLQSYGTAARIQGDRITGISVGNATGREARYELGTDGVTGYKVPRPECGITINQLEYGEIDIFQALANKAYSTVTLQHTDFYTSAIDLLVYLNYNDDTFFCTEMWPKARVSGFTVSIPSPQDDITRTFNLVSNDKFSWYYNNKYVIEVIDTVGSGYSAASYDIVIGSGDYADYPDPVVDPNNSGEYIHRIIRTRSGNTTELVEGTDFSYVSGSTTITIDSATTGDVYDVIYTATSYITGVDPFTSNTSDLSGINADSCSVYLTNTSNYAYRLQGVDIACSFSRQDLSEVGNKEVVQRGVDSTDVTVTLPRNLETFVIDELLSGVSTNHGKIDIREYATNSVVIVKFYSDSTKATFKYGIRLENLSLSNVDDSIATQSYGTQGNTLIGKEVIISTSESVINSGI